MNLDYAKQWADALSTDAQAFSAFYADNCCVEYGTYNDSVGEALLGPAAVREQMMQFSDGSNGKHQFKARNFEGHQGHGIIQWNWTGTGLKLYRGLPVNAPELRTVGQSFLMFDENGKIFRESTYWSEIRVVKVLGVPADAGHYWDL